MKPDSSLNGTRRDFLKQASLAAAGSVVAPNLLLAQGGDLIAETTLGKVRGVTIDGVHSFRGIPYGGDTSGKNRFMPPTRPRPWTGVRDCTDWGHIAPRPVKQQPAQRVHAGGGLEQLSRRT